MRRSIPLVLSLSVFVAACTGTTVSEVSSTPGPAGSAGAVTAGSGGDVLEIPCEESLGDVLVELGLADFESAAELAVTGEDGQPVESDAERPFDDVTMAGVGLCSVEVSPPVAAALAEVERAAAAGDLDEARRILEGLLATELSALATMGPGILAAGPAEEHDHLQKSKDALAAAKTAARSNLADEERQFLDLAQEEFTKYALGDKDHPGQVATMEELRGLNELMGMAAQGFLIGAREAGEEAHRTAVSVAVEKVAEAIDDFEPCTATPRERERFGELVSQAVTLGAEEDPGTVIARAVQKVQTALEIQIARRLGEYVPECDVAATISATGSSVFEGVRVEVSADLRTCDGRTWEGLYEHRFVDPAGATGEITALADVVVKLPDMSGTASTDVVFVVGGTVFYEEQGASVTLTYSGTGIGAFTLTVDREAGTAVIVVAGEPMSVYEKDDAGDTYPWPHPGASGRMEAEVVDIDSCD